MYFRYRRSMLLKAVSQGCSRLGQWRSSIRTMVVDTSEWLDAVACTDRRGGKGEPGVCEDLHGLKWL